MKPKENKGYTPGVYDECQTPPYALEPLIPHLKEYKFSSDSYNPNTCIWECACGQGTLTREIERNNFNVLSTDIIYGTQYNFFSSPIAICENLIIVTNPPYSIKYEWLEHCYELDYPFALLMPVEMLGTARGQFLFDTYGIEIIFISPRVDFYMPNKGYEGGGAQFPTAWFTWKLNLPQQINFATLNKPKRSELKEYWEKAFI